MINLLPQSTKKEIRRERKFRLISVIVGFFVFSVWIIIGLSLPSLFSSYANYSVVVSKYSDLNNDQIGEEDKKVLDEFNVFSDMLGRLKPENIKKINLSNLIKVVLIDRTPTVKIRSFYFLKNDQSRGTLVISGISGTRENLLSFTKKLESNETFESVNLPVSNFSKKTDIEFSITLTLAN